MNKISLIELLPILASLLTGFFIASIGDYSLLTKNLFFSPSIYVILFIIIFSFFFIYALYEYKRGCIKFNKPYAFLFLYLIISGLIVTLVQPSNFSSGGLSITITNDVRWFSILEFTALLMAVYYCIFIFPNKFPTLSIMTVGAIIYIFVMFVSTIYSYVAEHEMYRQFFQNISKLDNDAMPEIHSFLGHHNVYGMNLVGAMFASMYLSSRTKKKWSFLLILFFTINVVFSSSLGSILTALLLLFFYVVTKLVVSFSEHKKIVIIISSFLGALVAVFVILSIIANVTGGNKMKFIFDFYQLIFNGRTSISRKKVWANSITLINQNCGWIFGRGDVPFRAMLYPLTSLDNDPVYLSHNTVLQLIGTGGIPYLLIHASLIVRGFVLAYKNFKHNKEIILLSVFATISFFLYSLIESNELSLLTVLFPVYLINAQYNHENKTVEIQIDNNENNKVLQSISFGFALIMVFLSGICYPLISSYGVHLIYVPFVIFGSIVLVQTLLSYFLNKQNFNLKIYLKTVYKNILVGFVFTILSIVYCFLFKEGNIAKGILISALFSALAISIYIVIPNLSANTGLNTKINYIENKLNNFVLSRFHD